MPLVNVNSEHDQFVSVLNQLVNEREILLRENEYLKAKLNESLLIETINGMKKERDLLFKLLSNLTTKSNYDEQVRYIKQQLKENNTNSLPMSSYRTLNGKSINNNTLSAQQNSTLSQHKRSLMMNYGYVHRVKANIEQQQQPQVIYRFDNRRENSVNNLNRLSSSSTICMKPSETNQKLIFYKTPQTQESNKLIRKQGVQLKHSQNSPFQQYRSRSLQDLT